MTQRVIIAVLLGLIVGIWIGVIALQAQEKEEPRDQGATGILVEARAELDRAIRDATGRLSPEQKKGAMKIFEQELFKSRKKFGDDQFYQELVGLSDSYWETRDFDDSIRLALYVTDNNPKSIYSAKAWFRIGLIYYGNKVQPAKAIEFYEKSLSVLEELKLEDDLVAGNLRSQALSTLGDLYWITGDTAKASETFEKFLSDEKLAKFAEPESLLNANLMLGRILARAGEAEKAIERLRKAAELCQKGNTGLDFQVSCQMEYARALGRKEGRKSQFEELLKIWKNKKYVHTPNIIRCGNELVLISFFDAKELEDGEFTKISDEVPMRAEKILKANESLAPSSFEFLQNIPTQAVLLRVALFDGEGPDKKARDKEKFEADLKEFRKRKQEWGFEMEVTTDFPQETAEKVHLFAEKYGKVK